MYTCLLHVHRSEHRKLLQSCKAALAQTGSAFVTWGHHDPHKTELDLNFFELATSEEFNFKLQHLAPVQYTDLFQENDGLDDARGLVYTCIMTLQ
jgi:predicted nicotinamide N-methyase